MPQPIIFYDIPSRIKGKTWSPNTWKTRYCLNIKGIPYTTVWVEYPDIELLCKNIGARPTSMKADGSPHYTLPVIHDPNTNETVAESGAIVRYLDKTYPDTRRLVPEEADALVAAFDYAFWAAFRQGTEFVDEPLILYTVYAALRARSKPYFRETREEQLGTRLEELAPPGSDKRASYWMHVERSLHRIAASWLEADGKEKLLCMPGDAVGITYPDIVIAAWFMWFKTLLGEGDPEWKRMMTWDGGRWDRFMGVFEKYEEVDDGSDVQLE